MVQILIKEDAALIRYMPIWAIMSMVLLASGLILGPDMAQAQDFTNADLEGRYGFRGFGTITATGLPAPVGTPIFAVGLFEFDGAGACRAIDQLNIGGTIFPNPIDFRTTAGDGACMYIVNTDGTGIGEATFGPSQPIPGAIQFTFVLVDDAKEMRFITTETPGFSATGVFKKQVDDDIE